MPLVKTASILSCAAVGALLLLPLQTASAKDRCASPITTADILDCVNAELAIEDKRLNKAYKAAMKKVSDKKALRNVQRQWIKTRDKECAIDPDGGTAALVNAQGCLLDMTKQRANELEQLAK